MAAPLVKEARWKRQLAAAVYVVALGVGAVLVGVGAALLGSAVHHGISVAALTSHRVILVIGLASFAYAMREAGIWRVPLPSSPWQVPRTWTGLGLLPSMGLFGAAVGPGLLTRTAYPAYLFMVVWDAFVGIPAFGVVVGLLYAAGRSMGVVIAAFPRTTEAAESIPHNLRPLSEASHYLNAALLGMFFSYALVYSFFT